MQPATQAADKSEVHEILMFDNMYEKGTSSRMLIVEVRAVTRGTQPKMIFFPLAPDTADGQPQIQNSPSPDTATHKSTPSLPPTRADRRSTLAA
jgi:hypothetical protein